MLKQNCKKIYIATIKTSDPKVLQILSTVENLQPFEQIDPLVYRQILFSLKFVAEKEKGKIEQLSARKQTFPSFVS